VFNITELITVFFGEKQLSVTC